MPWAISYPQLHIMHVHPVAFYEAIVLWSGFIFIVLTKNKIKDDSRISIAILFYMIMRMFLLEGLYADGIWFGNTTSRIIYITFITICFGIFIKNYCKKKQLIYNGKRNIKEDSKDEKTK